MKRNAKELDHLMTSWLEEHIEDMPNKGQKAHDCTDVMLTLFAENDLIHGHKKEHVIKATVLNLITAGADTPSLTTTRALSSLLNNHKLLKKAQHEIYEVVGKERLAEESDIKNLVYLQAIVKETLRLYPAGPLSVPREALEDCTIAGYYVPKGTQLFVNIMEIAKNMDRPS